MKPISSIAAIIASLALPATAHAYSALYLFGDSLSDVGNTYNLTAGAVPAAPYADGRYSNGPIWAEGLSSDLGLGQVVASRLGGNDYAYGGAVTGYAGVPGPTDPVPTLAQQVTAFSSAVGGTAPVSALYSVWIGGNDLYAIIANGVIGGGQSPLQAAGEAVGAAASETASIAALAADGAKSFLVSLVPDLGQTPSLTSEGSAASNLGTYLSEAYNSALLTDLKILETQAGISVAIENAFTLLDSAVSDPAAYGFSNVTDACYTAGEPVCSSPNQYLFWDSIHPTATGQALIASAAEEAVPEPGTLATLFIALAGLAMSRRRRLAAMLRPGHAQGKPGA